MTVSYDKLVEKWSPILNETSAGEIKDAHRRAVTAAILENQEIAFREEAQINEVAGNANASVTGAADGVTGANWNPVLIALVRRAMPNLMAYDLAGVQPMTGPTGLIFAMKSRYQTTKGGTTAGSEALFQEPVAPYSGDSSNSQTTGPSGLAGLPDSICRFNRIRSQTALVHHQHHWVTRLLTQKHLALLVAMTSQKWVSQSRSQLLLHVRAR